MSGRGRRHHRQLEPGHHDEDVFTRIRCALITVSTSRYSKKENGDVISDKSGDLLAKELGKAGHKVTARWLVPDSILRIRHAVLSAASLDDIELIALVGGTGMARTDVTYEAIKPLLQREMFGFGEALRSESVVRIGPAGIFSNVTLGILDDDKIVVSLPGSPDGATAGAGLLIKLLPHLMSFIGSRSSPSPGRPSHDHPKVPQSH